MDKVDIYKLIDSWDEEDSRAICEELHLRYYEDPIRFCAKCGQKVLGENTGVILGTYSFLAPECDFSHINPVGTLRTKIRYEALKSLHMAYVRGLVTIRKLLEDFGWTTGKYYNKICHTERYAHSCTKTFETKIETGEYFDKLSPERPDCKAVKEAEE